MNQDYKSRIDSLFTEITNPLWTSKSETPGDIKSIGDYLQSHEDLLSYFNSGLDEHYLRVNSNIHALFHEFHEIIKNDDEDFFEYLCESIFNFSTTLELNRNDSFLTHPQVLLNIRGVYECFINNIKPNISNKNDEFNIHAMRTYVYIAYYNSSLLENIWNNKYQPHMEGTSDLISPRQFALSKGWLQKEIYQNLYSSELSDILELELIGLELKLRYVRISYFRGIHPLMIDELYNIESIPKITSEHLIQTLEDCNKRLIELIHEDEDDSTLIALLHFCREIRGHFQEHFDLFPDEPNWVAEELRVLTKQELFGGEIPLNYLGRVK